MLSSGKCDVTQKWRSPSRGADLAPCARVVPGCCEVSSVLGLLWIPLLTWSGATTTGPTRCSRAPCPGTCDRCLVVVVTSVKVAGKPLLQELTCFPHEILELEVNLNQRNTYFIKNNKNPFLDSKIKVFEGVPLLT